MSGVALPVLGALGITAVAAALAATLRSRGADLGRAVGDLPGPEVVVGYALSGLAAGAAAVVVGVMRFALLSADRFNVDVILAGLLVGTLVVGHAVHRLMRPRPARRT
jgi:hypothetical protein